jgi:hypothetical protein
MARHGGFSSTSGSAWDVGEGRPARREALRWRDRQVVGGRGKHTTDPTLPLATDCWPMTARAAGLGMKADAQTWPPVGGGRERVLRRRLQKPLQTSHASGGASARSNILQPHYALVTNPIRPQGTVRRPRANFTASCLVRRLHIRSLCPGLSTRAVLKIASAVRSGLT